MRIEAVAIRNFRSLKMVSLPGCSPVNILIGKNSSGKSNILAAIDAALEHIALGQLTSNWPTRGRAIDEIYGREPEGVIQVAIQFSADKNTNHAIIERITQEVEGIELTLKKAEEGSVLSIIIGGLMVEGSIARYVQELSFGALDLSSGRIRTMGHKIFSVPDAVAAELVAADRSLSKLQAEMKRLDRAETEIASRGLWGNREREDGNYFLRRMTENLTRERSRRVLSAAQTSKDAADFSPRIAEIRAELQSEIDEVQTRTTSQAMLAVSGSVRRPRDYVIPILQEVGKLQLLHFREVRQPVGAEEAAQLLRLKTTRGGPERLSAFQATVKSLLGVSVDAFEAEEDPRAISPTRGQTRPAEMDIDEFLVEANGAGIREALRILLDLELKRPNIALIEEPEVHLHPGLEKVMHSYVIRKGKDVQIFLPHILPASWT
jgi:hypothetical protein